MTSLIAQNPNNSLSTRPFINKVQKGNQLILGVFLHTMYLEVKLGTSPLTKLLIEMEIGLEKKRN